MERSDPKGGRVITFDRLRLNCQRNFTAWLYRDFTCEFACEFHNVYDRDFVKLCVSRDNSKNTYRRQHRTRKAAKISILLRNSYLWLSWILVPGFLYSTSYKFMWVSVFDLLEMYFVPKNCASSRSRGRNYDHVDVKYRTIFRGIRNLHIYCLLLPKSCVSCFI